MGRCSTTSYGRDGSPDRAREAPHTIVRPPPSGQPLPPRRDQDACTTPRGSAQRVRPHRVPDPLRIDAAHDRDDARRVPEQPRQRQHRAADAVLAAPWRRARRAARAGPARAGRRHAAAPPSPSRPPASGLHDTGVMPRSRHWSSVPSSRQSSRAEVDLDLVDDQRHGAGALHHRDSSDGRKLLTPNSRTLPCRFSCVEGRRDLLRVGQVVGAVQHVQVEAVGAQAAQRLLARAHDVRAREVPAVRRATRRDRPASGCRTCWRSASRSRMPGTSRSTRPKISSHRPLP